MLLRYFIFLLLFPTWASSQNVIGSYLQSSTYSSVEIDINGMLWLADSLGNFTSYDGKTFETTTTGDKDCILGMYDGDLYGHCKNGLYLIRSKPSLSQNRIPSPRRTEKNINLPLPGFDVMISTKTDLLNNRYILSGSNGKLYIGKDDWVKEYVIPDLPPLYDISHIKEHNDVIYIATSDSGMYIWNEPNYYLSHIDQYDGLASDTIHDFTFDKDNNCWVVSNNGVQVLQVHKNDTSEPPHLKLEEVYIGNKKIDPSVSHEVNGNHKPIKVKFSAVDLLRSQDLEYQSSVSIGAEATWLPLSSSETFIVQDLGSGTHHIQLRVTTDRKYFSYSDKIEIQVQDSIWQTYWPWIFGSFFLVGLMWLFSFLYYNRYIDRLTKQRDKIILENQLLKSKQQALQLQMNPHFLFNSLNAVQGLIALNENQKARKHLQSFSQMMRIMLNQSREEKISLEDEVKFLNQYLSLEQMARDNRFGFEITVDHDVDTAIDIPPMVIQPIVENAIIHGMKGLTKKGIIEVSFSIKQGYLQCMVDDNGVGRGYSQDVDHKSHGLDIIRERIKVYAGKKISDPIETIDKIDDSDIATGTQVKIKLPIL